MHKILQHKKLKTWPQKECVNCKINNLRASQLVNVGFLFEAFPRLDSALLLESRIATALGEHTFEFNIKITPIYPGRAPNTATAKKYPNRYSRSQVMMIRASDHDAHDLNSDLQRIPFNEEFTYYSWDEYLSLTNDQKRTIVNKQEEFIQNYKVLIFHQIKDDALITPMWVANYEDKNMEMIDTYKDQSVLEHTTVDLETTTIQTILTNHYIAGDGTPLFSFVYQPTLVTI